MAIATVVAQIINMLLLTRLLIRTDEPYRLSFRELKLKGVYLSNMFRLGIPSGLQNAMYGVSNMIVQIGVNSLGTVVVASWAMTSKIDGVFWAVSNALGAAITSFVKDPAVIDTTWEMILYFVPFYFTWTLIEVLSAVLRGSGDAVRPVIIIGLGICLFRILWICTVFRLVHTLPVLCLTYVSSWTLTSIMILLYFVRSDWRDRTRRILDK